MRVILQRVQAGSVTVFDNEHPAGRKKGNIGQGLVLLVGFKNGDHIESVSKLAKKVLDLRIFEDEDGKMNLSVKDIRGELLAVSQFTLYGDTSRGRRPGFSNAMPPENAEAMYLRFIKMLEGSGLKVASGQFGAKMKVEIINDGPVTFLLENEA